MCGIAGLFDLNTRRDADRGLLERMNTAQLHRGPDEGSTHVEPGVGLAHRRLSIIDVATGQQPLFNEDGSVCVIFNGELYNYRELVPELEALGHTFHTRSDTEVIVHAWEAWGRKCVDRFVGMFAFAVYDRNRDTLFVARDRLGEKPLYWSVTKSGWFVFGSELKAVLQSSEVARDLSPQAIEDYLALGYVPDPHTIFRGVYKLPPAHRLELVRGRTVPAPEAFWDAAFQPVPAASEEEVCRELIARLRESVKMQLMSEVPLGAFLSGGVDSSAVVALMAGLSSTPVNTCSIAFGDPNYDESAYARMVAQRYKTNHYSEHVDADDFDLIDGLARIYDEPFADSSAIPTYRVCELARKRVTVALSGDAGDENFAGYRRYRWFMNEERIRRFLPRGVRKPIFGTLGTFYPKIDWAPKIFRAKTTLEAIARDSLEGYFHGVCVMPDRLRLPLYTAQFREALAGHHALSRFEEHAARAPTQDPLSLVQYVDLKTYLPSDILVKVDRASMAHSLEVRVPMLDHRFVDWVSGLPAAMKLRGQEGKYIFKKSLESLLPRDVLYRPKMGFAVPLASWFRGPLRERVRRSLLDGALPGLGIFEKQPLARMVDEHQSGARDHSAALWTLLMFESFHRQIVEGRA